MTVALRYLRLVVLIGVGLAAVVAGEADDSPGLQGIGVLCVVIAIILHVRRPPGAPRRPGRPAPQED